METIKNNKKYGYTIQPMFGKVNAEIWYIFDNMEIHLLSKEFGSYFRSPNEKDYKKAQDWVLMQMKCIEESNNLEL